jgi:hypothetical protein
MKSKMKSKMQKSVVVRAVIGSAVVVHAACILGVVVWVDSVSTVFLCQQLLNFPCVRFDANGEFQILLGNGVPELENVSEMYTTKS